MISTAHFLGALCGASTALFALLVWLGVTGQLMAWLMVWMLVAAVGAHQAAQMGDPSFVEMLSSPWGVFFALAFGVPVLTAILRVVGLTPLVEEPPATPCVPVPPTPRRPGASP